MRRTIQDVKLDKKIKSTRHGDGMIAGKTKGTLTAVFENGNIVKLTYRHNDSYFYESDF